MLPSGSPSADRPAGRRRWLLRRGPWVLFVLLLALTGVRMQVDDWNWRVHRANFVDFSIFLAAAKHAQHSGTLYKTERPDFYMPGNRSYKFPPPLAAFLTLFPRALPSKHGKPCLIASLVMLFLSLALLLVMQRPGLPRSFLMILLFLNWLPFLESLAALQLEPLILLLLTLTLLLLLRGKVLSAGVPIGLAAALKVYAGGLVLYFVLRRWWRGVGGIALGSIALLGIAGLLLPLRHTFEYFFTVLPRLGGISLYRENISVLGNLGRLAASLLAGPEKSRELAGQLSVLGDCGVRGSLPLAAGLFVLLLLGLAFFTARAVRRAGVLKPGVRESLGLALGVCLYVPLFPSSWMNYQTLLVLPLLVAVALSPTPRRDPFTWVLLVLAALPALMVTNATALWRSHQEACLLARSLVPLWLWWALLRIFSARGAASTEEERQSIITRPTEGAAT